MRDEFGSRLRVVTLIGGKFSEVRARCTNGRRRVGTSVTATVKGVRGGSGTFGGGTVGGLRSARRTLKRAKSAEGSRIQGPFIAHRIAPLVLPLRERPPPTLLGTSPCPSPSIRDRSTEPISVPAAARAATGTHERSALQSHARTSLRTLDGTQPIICDAQTTPSPSQTGSPNTTEHRGRHARIARRTAALCEVVHYVFRRGSRYGIQFRGCRVGITVHAYGAVGGGMIRRAGMALGSWE